MRKFSRCSIKLIHFCKNNLQLVADRGKILCKYIMHMYFFKCWMWVLRFLFCYFQKFQFFVVNKFWHNFSCIARLFVWAQKVVCQIFKILFQTSKSVVSFLLGVFLSRYIQLKILFSDKTSSSCKRWDLLYW